MDEKKTGGNIGDFGDLTLIFRKPMKSRNLEQELNESRSNDFCANLAF